jgi:hypothetical protein
MELPMNDHRELLDITILFILLFLKLFYFSKNFLKSRNFSKNLNSFKLLKLSKNNYRDLKGSTCNTRYGNRNVHCLS